MAMSRFYVICRDENGSEYTETVRTDRRAAEEDAALIKAITGRTCRVEEANEAEKHDR